MYGEHKIVFSLMRLFVRSKKAENHGGNEGSAIKDLYGQTLIVRPDIVSWQAENSEPCRLRRTGYRRSRNRPRKGF